MTTGLPITYKTLSAPIARRVAHHKITVIADLNVSHEQRAKREL